MKVNKNGLNHKHCSSSSLSSLSILKMLIFIFWKYGIVLKTRWQFWSYLIQIALKYPDWVGGYIIGCGQMEHFLQFRQTIKERINQQLEIYQKNKSNIVKTDINTDINKVKVVI